MYLGYQGNKIKFYTEQPLNETLYNIDKTEKTNKEYVLDGEEYVLKDAHWEEEQAAKREASFKETFFEIPNFGWFRKVPKGYSSAVESLNTAFNAVSILQKLPAGMLIFYTAPDFTDPEQCTEEWLIEHQITNEEMSLQEFGAFYMAFMTAWNTQEHVNEVENDDNI